MSLCRALLAALAFAAVALPATAQELRRVSLEVTVTHVSQTPGGIDPRGEELHRQLRQDFRYGSLKVLERRELRLQLDEIGQLKLPNGRWMRVRPLNLASDRLLVAVEVEGFSVHTRSRRNFERLLLKRRLLARTPWVLLEYSADMMRRQPSRIAHEVESWRRQRSAASTA